MLKVSVLVPIYGVEKYIARCARSLFEQTYQNIEYVFVDDNSLDKSLDILKDVIEQYPKRKPCVKILRHENNQGLAVARNTAMSLATGDFIMHIDSDDYIDINCVEKCVECQEETNSDIIAFDQIILKSNYSYKSIKPDFKTPKDMALCVIRHDCPNGVCSNMIRRSLYVENNIKVIGNLSLGEDLQVLPRLLYFSAKVANLHDVYYYYDNTNDNSYTAQFSENIIQKTETVLHILYNFYSDKGSCYVDAINIRYMRTVAGIIKTAAILGGHKQFVLKLQKDIKRLIPTYGNQLSLPIKFGVSINNYYLLVLYMRTISQMKSIYKRLAKKIL